MRSFKTNNFGIEQEKEKLPKDFLLTLIIILDKKP